MRATRLLDISHPDVKVLILGLTDRIRHWPMKA